MTERNFDPRPGGERNDVVLVCWPCLRKRGVTKVLAIARVRSPGAPRAVCHVCGESERPWNDIDTAGLAQVRRSDLEGSADAPEDPMTAPLQCAEPGCRNLHPNAIQGIPGRATGWKCGEHDDPFTSTLLTADGHLRRAVCDLADIRYGSTDGELLTRLRTMRDTVRASKAQPAQWQDISSYDRHDTQRVPHTFECVAGDLRITVTRHLYLAPDQWGLACHELNIGTGCPRVLKSRDIEGAKREALDIIRKRLTRALASMGE